MRDFVEVGRKEYFEKKKITGSCFFILVNDLKLVVIANFGALIEQSWDVLHRLSWETDFDFFDEVRFSSNWNTMCIHALFTCWVKNVDFDVWC